MISRCFLWNLRRPHPPQVLCKPTASTLASRVRVSTSLRDVPQASLTTEKQKSARVDEKERDCKIPLWKMKICQFDSNWSEPSNHMDFRWIFIQIITISSKSNDFHENQSKIPSDLGNLGRISSPPPKELAGDVPQASFATEKQKCARVDEKEWDCLDPASEGHALASVVDLLPSPVAHFIKHRAKSVPDCVLTPQSA